MTESKNKKKYQENQDSQPSEETQTEYREISKEEKKGLKQVFKESTSKTQAEYREISNEELKQILEDHKKWLESDGKEGQKANFENTNLAGRSGHRANFQNLNLQGLNFRNARIVSGIFNETNLDSADFYKAILKKADFRFAKLSNASLRKADLTISCLKKTQIQEANLEKAILINAHLEEAECQDTNFRKAKLANAHFADAKLNRANLQKADLSYVDGLNTAEIQHADLRGATGLLGNEFAQANVTGTKLPNDIKDFKALETVEKTSQNARKIFFAMLLGCVYSWLTIATTTDVRLLTNTVSSPLPIIGTEIPIAWFYLAAPFALIALYLYFHFYLQDLWEALASLPAIFPDGKRLDERAYPWLLNTLVRRHFKRLKNRPLFARMKEWITIFLAWFVVPLTLIGFWLRFIPRHDLMGTCLHIGLMVLSVALGIIFYRLCALTLQGKKESFIGFKKLFSVRGFYYSKLKYLIFFAFIFFMGLLFSLISVGAINGIKPDNQYKPKLKDLYSIEIKKVVPWAFNKIGYDVFAGFQEKNVSEIPSNYGAIAKEERLEFVKGANLKGRNLNHADMSNAFLVKADFRGALLNDAILLDANLHKANFEGAKMVEANISGANLLRANLSGANLNNAILEGANLTEAELRQSNLHKANLRQSNSRQAKFQGSNLQQAKLGGAKLKEAIFWKTNLQEANFGEADLQEAIFWDANLQQANFWDANLQQAYLLNANLQKAYLSGAKNLTIEQLSKAKTLYQATLDPELLEQVKKCCPHLLEEP